MSSLLLDTVKRHKSGETVGVYSVCSAHPLVIEAAVLQALDDEGYLLVEATSNQVDQFGGYTGMSLGTFGGSYWAWQDAMGCRKIASSWAATTSAPTGGRSSPRRKLWRTRGILSKSYVAAGFTKIHLDCSMPCADDPAPWTTTW